jgi:putative hemolysin
VKTTQSESRRPVMTLREALLSAGFSVEVREPSHPNIESELYAECCGQPVSSEAWAGGIFGPARVWCERCGGEVAQRTDHDAYGVEKTCGSAE